MNGKSLQAPTIDKGGHCARFVDQALRGWAAGVGGTQHPRLLPPSLGQWGAGSSGEHRKGGRGPSPPTLSSLGAQQHPFPQLPWLLFLGWARIPSPPAATTDLFQTRRQIPASSLCLGCCEESVDRVASTTEVYFSGSQGSLRAGCWQTGFPGGLASGACRRLLLPCPHLSSSLGLCFPTHTLALGAPPSRPQPTLTPSQGLTPVPHHTGSQGRAPALGPSLSHSCLLAIST